jgi:tRNA(Ile)-lysidine synthase
VLVSGGPDSLALLHLLHGLAGRLELKLEVLHFDHGLRPESGAEADWVAARAAALELPVHIVRAEHLREQARGVQAAARAWRRAETLRLLARWGADWAATGHQRDDQVETWLLKWLRGAHLSGLRGMDWRSGPFIRPLLETPRAALTAYLGALGTDWLEDPSNRQGRYRRNRVRHELIPLLEELSGGGLARRLEELSGQSRQLAAWLEEALASRSLPGSAPGELPYWLDAAALLALPPLPRASLLHRWVTERMPGALAQAPLQQASSLLEGERGQWSLDLSQGRVLRREGERLLLEARNAPGPPHGPCEVTLGPWRLRLPPGWRAELEPAREAVGGQDADASAVGTATLHGIPTGSLLEVRFRRAGDRFHPPWKAHPVKLKDFLRDQGVPRCQRAQVPLVLLEERIVAVYPRHVARGHDRAAGGHPPLRLRLLPP